MAKDAGNSRPMSHLCATAAEDKLRQHTSRYVREGSRSVIDTRRAVLQRIQMQVLAEGEEAGRK